MRALFFSSRYRVMRAERGQGRRCRDGATRGLGNFGIVVGAGRAGVYSPNADEDERGDCARFCAGLRGQCADGPLRRECTARAKGGLRVRTGRARFTVKDAIVGNGWTCCPRGEEEGPLCRGECADAQRCFLDDVARNGPVLLADGCTSFLPSSRSAFSSYADTHLVPHRRRPLKTVGVSGYMFEMEPRAGLPSYGDWARRRRLEDERACLPRLRSRDVGGRRRWKYVHVALRGFRRQRVRWDTIWSLFCLPAPVVSVIDFSWHLRVLILSWFGGARAFSFRSVFALGTVLALLYWLFLVFALLTLHEPTCADPDALCTGLKNVDPGCAFEGEEHIVVLRPLEALRRDHVGLLIWV
ncbi:hypothetical protein B0H16DRAFT_1452116 [Mycena metata]|uniref:Uncharacterized protein n=1 Tax=Mycena metata TaxID=1033252 RepID=A0AAD7NPV7_9AGAR|nr:hypothetical protein B0H16DRAFT_1452116 [Mycena metata]